MKALSIFCAARSSKAVIELGTYRVASASAQPLQGEVNVTFRADSSGVTLGANYKSGGDPLVVTRVAP